MRVLVKTLALVTALSGAALAEGAYLTERAARATFLGIDMGGVHEPGGARWRECVNRRGETQYWYGGRMDHGRLTVRADGALCFSYASSNYRDSSCWRARETGRGTFRFESLDGGADAFIAQQTRRVSGCEGADAPIS